MRLKQNIYQGQTAPIDIKTPSLNTLTIRVLSEQSTTAYG